MNPAFIPRLVNGPLATPGCISNCAGKAGPSCSTSGRMTASLPETCAGSATSVSRTVIWITSSGSTGCCGCFWGGIRPCGCVVRPVFWTALRANSVATPGIWWTGIVFRLRWQRSGRIRSGAPSFRRRAVSGGRRYPSSPFTAWSWMSRHSVFARLIWITASTPWRLRLKRRAI